MQNLPTLEPGRTYHIYNRGINGTTLFPGWDHYRLFLKQYAFYSEAGLDTFAYCLMNNHFHLLVRVKEADEWDLERWKAERGWTKISEPHRLLGHCFNSYTQQLNKRLDRTGSLFEKPFHRERVTDDTYFTQLIYYIHANPFKHSFVGDFRLYPHSSYQSLLSEKPTLLKRDKVLDWFGGRQAFIDFHLGMEATSPTNPAPARGQRPWQW